MSPSSAAPLADRWGDRLPRRLGFWSAVAVLVGSTIGGGIFRTPAVIAARVPAPLPMFGVWVLGGLLALCGALTYAELAALFPRSGGVYVYIREGFGRLPAFLFGWTELVLIRASALGAIATPFAEYLLRSIGRNPGLPENAGLVHYVAAAAIAVTAALNYYGVRWGALVLNLTTGAKYGALLVLVLLAFLVGQGDWTHFTTATGPVTPGLFGLGAVTVVVMLATFSTLVGSILTAPRIFFAMADDGLFFRAIATVHPRYQTPSAAIVLTAFLGIGFVLIRTFEQLADQFVVAIFPFYALAAAAVFVLRRRRPDLPRPVRVLGYPAVPLLFVLASFLILGNALWAHPLETGFAFLIIALGVPVYSW